MSGVNYIPSELGQGFSPHQGVSRPHTAPTLESKYKVILHHNTATTPILQTEKMEQKRSCLFRVCFEIDIIVTRKTGSLETGCYNRTHAHKALHVSPGP